MSHLTHPTEGNNWDSLLSRLSFLAIASYLLFYVLIPDAYAFGPTVMLLLALFGFRWKRLINNVDRQSRRLIAALWLFFLGQALPLVLHGENLSQFDLSTRYVAASIVLLFVLKYPISARWFFLLVTLGALMAGVYGIYQFTFQGVARVAAFDNPIHYGNGAMGLALLAFAGLFWSARQPSRFFWLSMLSLGFIGGVYASLVSGTRSGWVALPVLIFIGIYAFWRPMIERKVLFSLVALFAVAGLAIVSQVDLVTKRAEVAVEEFGDYFEEGRNSTSVGLRLDMWKAGLAAFLENPVIGSGPEGTEQVIAGLIAKGEIHPEVDSFRHLHNQYIDMMARYGLLGLASYLVLLGVTFTSFLQETRSEIPSVKALAFGGLLFVCLHGVVNLTQSMLERNIGVTMFVFMVVFIWAVLKNEERRQSDPSRETENNPVARKSH